jgi:hypothetical protein
MSSTLITLNVFKADFAKQAHLRLRFLCLQKITNLMLLNYLTYWYT